MRFLKLEAKEQYSIVFFLALVFISIYNDKKQKWQNAEKIRKKSLFIHFCRVYSRNTEQISFPDFSSFFLSRLLCLMNAGRANREPHTKMDLQDTLLGVRLFCMRALILVIVKRGSIWCCLPLSMWSMWRQKDLCQMNRGY